MRELKNRLSEYVSRVKAGESVLVTDRGHTIAELRPASKTAGVVRSRKLSLADLERSGLLTPGKPNHRNLYPRMTKVLRRRSSAELLDEERGRQ